MAKSPDAFRTISEVSALLETPAHVLRFWEGKFEHIRPVKRAGGRRYYRPADIALLAGIKVLLHEQGLMIRGVQKLLREQGPRHVASLSPLPWDNPPQDGPLFDGLPSDGLLSDGGMADDPRGGAPTSGQDPVIGEPDDGGPDNGGTVIEDAPPDNEPEREGTPGRVTVEALLVRLAEADPDRLRAQAARMAPLVQRLAALRARTRPGELEAGARPPTAERPSDVGVSGLGSRPAPLPPSLESL